MTARIQLLDDLQKKNAASVGFLPLHALEMYENQGRIAYAQENGDDCGYMIRGIWRNHTRVYQTVIAKDARRIEHGRTLNRRLVEDAILRRTERIILHCAADLAANEFWEALGYKQTGERRRRRDKYRPQIRWELILPTETARLERERIELEQQGLTKFAAMMAKQTIGGKPIKLRRATTGRLTTKLTC